MRYRIIYRCKYSREQFKTDKSGLLDQIEQTYYRLADSMRGLSHYSYEYMKLYAAQRLYRAKVEHQYEQLNRLVRDRQSGKRSVPAPPRSTRVRRPLLLRHAYKRDIRVLLSQVCIVFLIIFAANVNLVASRPGALNLIVTSDQAQYFRNLTYTGDLYDFLIPVPTWLPEGYVLNVEHKSNSSVHRSYAQLGYNYSYTSKFDIDCTFPGMQHSIYYDNETSDIVELQIGDLMITRVIDPDHPRYVRYFWLHHEAVFVTVSTDLSPADAEKVIAMMEEEMYHREKLWG